MTAHFRNVVKRMRSAAGVSQTELAVRLGTTQSAVARWETGEVSPRLNTLERIAEACGLEAHVVWPDRGRRDGPASPAWRDAVIEAYKKDIDRTLLRENLKLTLEQRLQQLQQLAEFADKFRGLARRA
jgi:transcriptional regulator with XRE-family HTH domain